ncbi:MAG: hypothetical protein A3K18_35025 [Lentisphaerae bacterium RIFOXYA12_64_32]|nr:MAG: hypothetical protein A3K18_35025 [Lentisphaerae bacterium RIFOXYA12_64_32]
MMKMDGEIRVKTDGLYGRLYNDLKNSVAGDFHEVFFACACIGYKRQQRKSLGKHRDERFWSKTITPREWSCYYAMVLADCDMDFAVVQDDKKVIMKIEEYANAGMAILIEERLHDYLLSSTEEPQLDPTVSKELPKDFLHFLFEQEESNKADRDP